MMNLKDKAQYNPPPPLLKRGMIAVTPVLIYANLIHVKFLLTASISVNVPCTLSKSNIYLCIKS